MAGIKNYPFMINNVIKVFTIISCIEIVANDRMISKSIQSSSICSIAYK